MNRIVQLILLFLAPSLMARDAWFSGAQEFQATGEVLSADDIQIRSYQTLYSGMEGSWTFELVLNWTEYREKYSPILFGEDSDLFEENLQANLSISRKWSDQLQSTVSFGAYEGFADYRSIWISEFYRQFFGAFPAYYAPDPHGHSFGIGMTWDYLPGRGKASLNLGYARDEIAPGWSFNPFLGAPEPGLEVLETLSGNLRVDQVLAPWLKTGLQLTARQTTDRSARYGIVNHWAATAGAVGLRLAAGYTSESPSFTAAYGSGIIEWNFLPNWSVHIGYQVYQDEGEIQTSGFNALAPPIDSRERFCGLRWERGDLSVSGGIGFLSTDYEALSEDNEFFGNLYKDREWMTFRLSASLRF